MRAVQCSQGRTDGEGLFSSSPFTASDFWVREAFGWESSNPVLVILSYGFFQVPRAPSPPPGVASWSEELPDWAEPGHPASGSIRGSLLTSLEH